MDNGINTTLASFTTTGYTGVPCVAGRAFLRPRSVLRPSIGLMPFSQ